MFGSLSPASSAKSEHGHLPVLESEAVFTSKANTRSNTAYAVLRNMHIAVTLRWGFGVLGFT